ncbi:hypothetical protein HAP94_23980 [Acidithiobacillus ferrivorans]|nr:hypothetical protein [Acidithiobacillus ferrivorans]
MSMVYWVATMALVWRITISLLLYILPEPKAAYRPSLHICLDPCAPGGGGGGALMSDSWNNIIHNRRLDLWPRYIADARTAGHESLTQCLQCLLDQNATSGCATKGETYAL